MDRDEFDAALKDALENLYDPGALQTNRLAAVLCLHDTPGTTASQQLRKLLLEVLETLRPLDNIPFHRPEWMGYRILQLRYVEGLRQAEICRELSLGHTSFYNQLRSALDAVASVLWARLPFEPLETAQGPHLSVPTAKDEAMSAARVAPRVLLDPAQIWMEAMNFVAPFAAQRGISLPSLSLPLLPAVSADQATLRQIFINILAEIVSNTLPGILPVKVGVTAGEISWQIPISTDLFTQPSTTLAICQGILEVYGGALENSVPEGFLSIKLPARHSPNILVVDDNEDAAGLIQRYLQGGYQLRAAHNGAEAETMIAVEKPDLILLDVILPHQDGWNILQRLKTLPETARIPVIICSVLTHPDLALLMGADGVLQKPVEPEVLIPMVDRLLLRSGNAVEPGRSTD
jgi:CheY-like chemotaxis protein